jgi:hypothetical protein
MPRNEDQLGQNFSRRAFRLLNQIQPPKSINDLLTKFADPPDPVGFAKEICKLLPWKRQRDILEGVARCMRVATVSGHKVGKSTALAILALWFYCSFPNARVVITATTDNQVNGIIWREIKRLIKRARRAGFEIPGTPDMGIKARTGLTHPITDSEIRGYTAKEAEAIAGVSGDYILYLVDEASGVEDHIFQAIEGNRAGGNAWVFLISNPTRAEGEFFDAHHTKSREILGTAGYLTLHIDSRESPNITGEWKTLKEWDWRKEAWTPRTKPIPGLATLGWVEEKAAEWGEDGALFKVRVAGLFVVAEEAKVFQLALILEAEKRWPDTAASGRLWIGCDPAGDGDGGDESGFAARRGQKLLELRARSGISPNQHIEIIQDLIATHQPDRKFRPILPAVLIESEGEVGWKVYCAIRDHAERTSEFEVVRVRTSERAVRQPGIYQLVRDEIYACAREWMRSGGAIPENTKLEKDLHAPEFKSNLRGRLELTKKKDLRKMLGRSTDLGDAFAVSCWEPISLRIEANDPASAHVQATGSQFDAVDQVELDPYGGADLFR